MVAYTEVANQVADARDAGKVSDDHIAEFKAAMKPVRAALNAWRDSIGDDGTTEDISFRELAARLLADLRLNYGRAP